MSRHILSRNLFLFFFSITTLLVFYGPLKLLLVRSFHDELYDYIIIIPLVSAYFFYIKRKEIFSDQEYSVQAGTGIIVFGILLYLIGVGQENRFNQSDYLSLVIFSSIVFWIGGFTLFNGLKTLRKALFPLLFLILMVPLPTPVLEKIISILQEGSTEAAFTIFKLFGVPVLREGFVFHLPQLSIEVAEECSGIHSAVALFITSLIVGKLFLNSGWRRCVLSLSIFPIAIVKNGLRIVTLSLLGSYVDERILSGALHKQGGIPFFLLAVSFLLIVLWVLKRMERRTRPSTRMS